MKVLIIDDDIKAINVLSEKLSSFSEINIVGSCTNGETGLELFRKTKPDILFLDIELPDMSGIDFIDRLNMLYTYSTKIIIYSSHQDYILSAFRKEAFDFLSKPIDIYELAQILKRYHSCNTFKNNICELNNRNSYIDNNKKLLLYTGTNDFILLHTNEIGYFKYISSRKMWEAVIIGHKNIILKKKTTADMITDIDRKFIQVHQSYIVNIDYMIEVSDSKCVLYPPFDDVDDIVIGRTFRKKLIDNFYNI